jgi:Fe-S cluster assembly scaffold protein SufB
MDVKKVSSIAEQEYNETEWESTAGFSGGIIVTPTGVKFDGRLANFMYRDVTPNRYNTEKYRHYFESNNMIGDIASSDHRIHALTISNKAKEKDYVIHYTTRADSNVRPTVGVDGHGDSYDLSKSYNTMCLYIEVSPYSNVILNEHFWKDSPCKIVRIVYVLREGSNLTINRHYKKGPAQEEHSTEVIESRIIQHPTSKLNVNATNFGNIEYLQDLYFVTSYLGAVTNFQNKYIVQDKQSVHCIADVEHVGPEGVSNIDIKSITNDTSKFTFAGNIKVEKQAEKVDANLQNKNLQMSDTSVVVTEPKLDISTKEIKCTHGCTVSSVDPDQLYLLNARGFDKQQATDILTEAFLNG